MSLDWNLAHIADHKTVCFRAPTANEIAEGMNEDALVMKPVTEALIWATMGIGMNTITASTVDAFFKRIAFYEAVHGTWMQRAGEPDADGNWKVEPRPITIEEVRQHIGLRTNASRFTDSQFANLMFRNFRRGR